ncbi:MAG: helix-turn-helix transcriptional regulator [bacterium]|nr:helix-turn-helix transcriptional regulator [bacterium]
MWVKRVILQLPATAMPKTRLKNAIEHGLDAIIYLMRDVAWLPWPVPLPAVDDPEIMSVLRHLAEACDDANAELILECTSTGERQRYSCGQILDSNELIDLQTDGTVAASIRIAGDGLLPKWALGLLSLALRAVIGRHRLAHRAAMLGTAMDKTTSSVMLFDDQGEIIYANEAADRLLSHQMETSLKAHTEGFEPQPLLDLLFALAEQLGMSDTPFWRGELMLSDNSALICEMMAVKASGPCEKSGAWTVLRRQGGTERDCLKRFACECNLSPREVDVLQLLVHGQGTLELAGSLGISHHTVRDHLRSLYRKTKTGSRNELLAQVAVAAMSSVESVMGHTRNQTGSDPEDLKG